MVNLVDAFKEELTVRSQLPSSIQSFHTYIPLQDGVRLSAYVWLPVDAETQPVPAIVEYIPYRHRDYTALRDSMIHPWFAGHGYAAVRVDLRGSGDSEGVPMDEYVHQEQDDGLDILEWIAAQPWCNGKTGMMGISWGGFNALQIAARRPPSLSAIVTVCSTDDRYSDDVHYVGGCLISDNLTWGTLCYANMVRPPDPLVVGEDWRSLWEQRLNEAPVPLLNWLSHQARDDYWAHGSVCENYDAIQCPVYAVGGWADSYTNAIARLMQGLSVPRKALVGPWGHAYPHLASPGPRIGFLQEALRWWDRWLKETANGIDNEPTYTYWLQDSVRPKTAYAERPGRWQHSSEWPPESSTGLSYHLDGTGLTDQPTEQARIIIDSPCDTGVHMGEWMPLGVGAEMPGDQRLEDAGGVVFESSPLLVDVCIAGAPHVELNLSATQPVAQVSVKLSEVHPDGAATRISYGVLNLTHRDSHRDPTELVPAKQYSVQVPLYDIAYHVPAGHRFRLTVASAQWPLIWPTPQPVVLSLDTENSTLHLPIHTPTDGSHPFSSPEIAPPIEVDWLREVNHHRIIRHDVAANTTTLRHSRDEGAFRIKQHGLVVDSSGVEEHKICASDPLSAQGKVHWELRLGRDDWQTLIACEVVQRATAESFNIAIKLRAELNEEVVFARDTHHKIPRRLV